MRSKILSEDGVKFVFIDLKYFFVCKGFFIEQWKLFFEVDIMIFDVLFCYWFVYLKSV